MSTIYVLILTMHGMSCSSGCMTTAQFASLEACQAAAEKVHDEWSSAKGICVPYSKN